jgi:predicted nucleic acid-binding Zn ribbon protein
MAARALTTCEQCGGHDDHPKQHIGTVTKHNDCLSISEKSMVIASSDDAATIIEACEGGLRGPELLTYIQELHQEEVK